MQYNQAILAAAGEHIGLTEWPGAKHNPAIVQMFADKGHDWVQDDETPWCAAFVGSVLASLGLPHTGKLNARSYLVWGSEVRMQDARPGDVVVLWRGSLTSWQGHVAFLVRFDGDRVILRGGNQGNAVSDAPYARDRILGIRRADGVQARGSRPVLRSGNRGAFVLDLQDQLVRLGYTLGQKDGAFGARTLAAVIAFQSENGLTADGIVGDRTWAALEGAEKRQPRQITMADLRDVTRTPSRTVAEADKGKDIVVKGGGALSTGIIVDQVNQINEAVNQATGMANMLAGLSLNVLIILGVIAVFWFVYSKFGRIQEIRLNDARTGANDRI
jgi:uncharacterized protein (TIGR02594 family)